MAFIEASIQGTVLTTPIYCRGEKEYVREPLDEIRTAP